MDKLERQKRYSSSLKPRLPQRPPSHRDKDGGDSVVLTTSQHFDRHTGEKEFEEVSVISFRERMAQWTKSGKSQTHQSVNIRSTKSNAKSIRSSRSSRKSHFKGSTLRPI